MTRVQLIVLFRRIGYNESILKRLNYLFFLEHCQYLVTGKDDFSSSLSFFSSSSFFSSPLHWYRMTWEHSIEAGIVKVSYIICKFLNIIFPNMAIGKRKIIEFLPVFWWSQQTKITVRARESHSYKVFISSSSLCPDLVQLHLLLEPRLCSSHVLLLQMSFSWWVGGGGVW